MRGLEFFRIVHIDTEEKAKLLSIYTDANANPNMCFKILFFWHVLVYPSKNDQIAIEFINNNFNKINLPEEYIKVICDGTFGKIENDNVGYYIKTKIRHPIAHIVMNSGVTIDLDNKKQHRHLWAVAEMLKEMAKYKLNNDYNFKEYTPLSVCHLFNPDKEVFPEE